MSEEDRELLRLAAKASGVNLVWDGESPKELVNHWSGNPEDGGETKGYDWNPLEDDGDALRLAVKLNFEIERSKFADRAYVGRVNEAPWVEYVTDELDLYQVTRRAIVRAAAEIGKAMPEEQDNE